MTSCLWVCWVGPLQNRPNKMRGWGGEGRWEEKNPTTSKTKCYCSQVPGLCKPLHAIMQMKNCQPISLKQDPLLQEPQNLGCEWLLSSSVAGRVPQEEPRGTSSLTGPRFRSSQVPRDLRFSAAHLDPSSRLSNRKLAGSESCRVQHQGSWEEG